MKWVGLTGGLGSGKSTVARALQARHFPVLDADQVARDVVVKGSTGLQSVLQALGTHLLLPSGDLDRSKLAQEIFFDKTKKQLLESIMHPLIRQDVQRRKDELEAQGVQIALYDIPLLYETDSEKLFDAVLLVTCSRPTQVRRLKARNNWSDAEVEARLLAQLPLLEKEKRADFVIVNEGTLEDLELEVDRAQKWLESL